MGEIVVTDAILALLLPKPTESDSVGVEITTMQKQVEGQRELLDKIDMMGLWDWQSEDQNEAHDLIMEYASISAKHGMDLGKMSLVKHTIRLTDDTPFKECYRHIPPSMYQEVHNHLKEMLEIGAIQLSQSPWASPVILVQKKDGKFQFCNDLWNEMLEQ